MNIVDVPLDGEYRSDTLSISNQELVNCYVNIPQTPSFAPSNLFGTSGLTQILTTGAIQEANRGSHVFDDVLYIVNGTTLYQINRIIAFNGDESFNAVALGTITGTDRVSMADNGRQLMIVANGEGWIYEPNAVPEFQLIPDADFKASGNPLQVVFIDGFFLVSTDQKKLVASDINNGLSWDALRFGSAEADPDPINGIVENKGRVFVGGSQSMEVFENAGLGGFPFQRVSGYVIPKGVTAANTLIQFQSSIVWVGAGENERPAVWLLNGTEPQRISNTSIDNTLHDLSDSDIAQGFAMVYAEKGAYFVIFTFPSVTFAYDIITQKWHERRSDVINAQGVQEDTRWRVNSLKSVYGRVLCMDYLDGRVGVLDSDVYKEYGRTIKRSFSVATLYNQGRQISIPMVELTMEGGVGNQDSENPVILLRTSADGVTFNNALPKALGVAGAFQQRQIWRRLGRFPRLCVIKFNYTEPCKFAALKLAVGIKIG